MRIDRLRRHVNGPRVARAGGRALAAAALVAAAPAALAQAPAPALVRPATEAEEIALALSAAPESLRAAAGVYVLGEKGYRLVRPGTNGVACLVARSRPDTQEPICWDPEGVATILPVTLAEAEWRAAGATGAEVDRRVAEGFSSGRFRAPRRPGVAYMLSPDNWVFNGTRVIRFGPHLMFYAPYLTNQDLGVDGTDPGAPWVLHEGSPHAYIIVVTRR